MTRFSDTTRRSLLGTAAFLALGLLVSGSPSAMAATAAKTGAGPGVVSAKPVIGVIDLQAILGKSTAARMVASQRENYLNTYQAVVAEKEKELRAVDQKLAQERPTLDAATFKKRRDDFQSQVSRFQKEVEARRHNLERAYTKAMNEIQATVIGKTKDIANERGLNMIVYRSQVFLFDPSMDITDEVLAAVNKSFPKATMPDPDHLPPAKEGK